MAEDILADLMGSVLIVAPAVFGMIFAYWLFKKVAKISLFRQSREDDEALLRRMERADESGGEPDSYQKLRQIYRDIQNGAKAFLAAEYRMCIIFLAVFGFAMVFFVAKTEFGWDFKIGILTAFSFVVGGVTSMVAGYVGMMIAVYTNARCTMCATLTPDALAWRESFNSAFRGGAVMGFALSGLGILVMYFLMCVYVTAFDVASEAVKLFECIAGFGLGGSAIAMFGRVGGGIYTKAADVGADLAGKVVAGIPEDDPRNPATIADNVGDNVGDVAGMGSDLFGSFAEATCAALVIAAQSHDLVSAGWDTLVFPLYISSVGILVCGAVSFVATDFYPVKNEQSIELVLKTQLALTTIGMTVCMYPICAMFIPEEFFSRPENVRLRVHGRRRVVQVRHERTAERVLLRLRRFVGRPHYRLRHRVLHLALVHPGSRGRALHGNRRGDQHHLRPRAWVQVHHHPRHDSRRHRVRGVFVDGHVRRRPRRARYAWHVVNLPRD